ncbi:MAG TPA: hypothetical protein VK076_04615 [Candidatus Sphingobacterium stercoripullorum]|uniref:Uncharacterized protein n=1 Tax=Candidatus Sphingobacterium stercoripullorum TaxID=2838759 RepID=A0A9D1WB14_9SPHI|nr:hypothetical protein [Candidatus Sphingobacterium stercoripullorum]HLR49834.1 hypothetical protein [Candidatus Sphingobacterium stercoripullorum]
MKNKKSKKGVWFSAIPLVLLLLFLIYRTNNDTSIDKLEGGFHIAAFIEGQTGDGNKEDIYAISVEQTTNADYDGCADMLAKDKEGKTTVYFFDHSSKYPMELSSQPPYYDSDQYKAIRIIKRSEGF